MKHVIGLIGKWLMVAVLVLLILVILGLVFAGPIVVSVVNKKGPELLQTGMSLDTFVFRLWEGRVGVHDLTIEQPDGFGSGNLLTLDKFSVNVRSKSLLEDTIVIERVLLDGLAVHLVKDTNGLMNVSVLGPSQAASSDSNTNTTAGGAGEDVEADTESKIIVVNDIVVTNIAINYTDMSLGNDPLTITIDDLLLTATNVVISDDPSIAQNTAEILLTAVIKQTDVPDAHIGLVSKMGHIGHDIPETAAALRLIGFDLHTVGPMVPPGVAGTIGGDALDLKADLTMSAEFLDCEMMMSTIADHYFPFYIRGTVDEPEFDTSSVLFGMVGRIGGGVGNMVGAVGHAGVDTVSAVGKGVVNLGKGVGDAVGSLAGVDSDKTDAVNVKDEKERLSMAKRWRKNIPVRWQQAWEEAMLFIQNVPYPIEPLYDEEDLNAPVPM